MMPCVARPCCNTPAKLLLFYYYNLSFFSPPSLFPFVFFFALFSFVSFSSFSAQILVYFIHNYCSIPQSHIVDARSFSFRRRRRRAAHSSRRRNYNSVQFEIGKYNKTRRVINKQTTPMFCT